MIKPVQAIIKKHVFKLFNLTIFEFTNTQLKTTRETPKKVWKEIGLINAELSSLFNEEIEDETKDREQTAAQRIAKPSFVS